MRKRLRDMRSISDMSDSIRSMRGMIEYILWYLSNTLNSGTPTPCELNIVGFNLYSSDTWVPTEIGTKDGGFGACVRSIQPYYNEDGDYMYARRIIRFGKYPGSALNQYADRGSPDCPVGTFVDQPDTGQVYVGVGWGHPNYGVGSPVDHGSYWQYTSGTTIEATPDLCDDPISALGWFYTSKIVRRYRIERDPTPGAGVMDGATYYWTATSVPNVRIRATVTPDSGSYTWAHDEYEKFIDLTIEVDEVLDVENKWESFGSRIGITVQQNARHTDCQLNHTWYVV